ncbi:MAG: Rieske (2Fe-2S) protein [Actinomycetota bacterium]|nr:Rieske (2Fe-2S) protein [Actinomycetota bacterium]
MVAAASEVPVGQARVVEVGGQRLVVAQPTAGSFVAFSTTCTHEGTPVNVFQGLELACPNHGSRFSAADGSVSRGPATAPLATVDVRLAGDQVVLG